MAATPEAQVRRSVRAAAVLAIAAIGAFGLVALVHLATRDRIVAAERAREQARFDEVLRGVAHDNDLLADRIELHDREATGDAAPVVAYRARLHGQLVAVVLEPVAPDGYSGPIRLMVALAAPAGRVLAVRVLQHHETPGLGDFIDTAHSRWVDRFVGRGPGNPDVPGWRVRKDGGDFDEFTGATVTSRAVVGAVGRALALYERHRAELLAAPATIAP